MSCTSCVGCKYLYTLDTGYSNYTWMDTGAHCALDRNPQLADGPDRPFDWRSSTPEQDNWPKTATGRCDAYAPGERLDFDVDGEDDMRHCEDFEQLRVVLAHAVRHLNGSRSYSRKRFYLTPWHDKWLLEDNPSSADDHLKLFDTEPAARAYLAIHNLLDDTQVEGE